MKLLSSILALFVLVVAAIAALIFSAQRTMLFPGTMRGEGLAALPRISGIEQLWLEIDAGSNGRAQRVEAWFIPAQQPSSPVPGVDATRRAPAVIFSHGNGELIDDWPRALSGFSELGMGLLLVEYPGYGRSEGSASESSIRETMLVAYDAVAARPDVDPNRIVLYGRSLGGGAVCTILDARPAAALILQSSFTSVADLSWQLMRVPGFLVRDPMRSRDAVSRYRGPTLVIHGRYDEIIPYGHGVELSEAAPQARLISYECQHNDCPPDWSRFWDDIAAFSRDAGILEP